MWEQQQKLLAGILIALHNFSGSSITSCEAVANTSLLYEMALLLPAHSILMQFFTQVVLA